MDASNAAGGGRSPEDLLAFLRTCREQARRDGRVKYASISLRVRHIDPLAVLGSLMEQEPPFCYLERPASEFALLGAEHAACATFSGPARFAEAKAWARALFADTLATGDADAPMAGPHLMAAFTFTDAAECDSVFEPGTVFLPRWQVARSGPFYTAVANLPVGPDADVEALAMRVLHAHAKFSNYRYEGTAAPHAPIAAASGISVRPVVAESDYAALVRLGLRAIDEGTFSKVVLARAVDAESPGEFDRVAILARLRDRHSSCNAFGFSSGMGGTLIGATPERLASVDARGLMRTEALAGSEPRGATPALDAALAARLLDSEKDGREHRLVVDSILRRLASIGIEARAESDPHLVQLSNVQHLRTPIEARMPEGAHLLDVAAILHPTPAVGGSPREPAVRFIADNEPVSRGLYSGIVGWFDARGRGDFHVCLRCALVSGNRARLHAGAGIVRGSDPDREAAETRVKLDAILRALADA